MTKVTKKKHRDSQHKDWTTVDVWHSRQTMPIENSGKSLWTYLAWRERWSGCVLCSTLVFQAAVQWSQHVLVSLTSGAKRSSSWACCKCWRPSTSLASCGPSTGRTYSSWKHGKTNKKWTTSFNKLTWGASSVTRPTDPRSTLPFLSSKRLSSFSRTLLPFRLLHNLIQLYFCIRESFNVCIMTKILRRRVWTLNRHKNKTIIPFSQQISK